MWGAIAGAVSDIFNGVVTLVEGAKNRAHQLTMQEKIANNAELQARLAREQTDFAATWQARLLAYGSYVVQHQNAEIQKLNLKADVLSGDFVAKCATQYEATGQVPVLCEAGGFSAEKMDEVQKRKIANAQAEQQKKMKSIVLIIALIAVVILTVRK